MNKIKFGWSEVNIVPENKKVTLVVEDAPV